ncbi:MAG: M28 family peptidase [Planctomycetota bacterium]|nr:M28 family peptidase [Planctomycetota bacterium]
MLFVPLAALGLSAALLLDHGAATKAPPIPKLVPAITRAEIEAHVRWLASDELGGRVTGTPECDRAAAYLAEVLRAQGADPAGDGGTFLQAVALERPRLKSTPRLAFVGPGDKRTELAYGPDFDLPWNEAAADALRVVVAKTAKDLPAQADRGIALFLDASAGERRRWLADGGFGAGEGFGAILAPGSKKAGRPRDPASMTGGLRRAGKEARRADGVIRVHGEALERLRGGSVLTIALHVEAEVERLTSSNVVGRIPGRSPRDGQERAVVISAHYDHIAHGHAAEKGTDTIYNGADDDASGVATVLEIAGALRAGAPLAADVIVLLATGEEVGLLGTEEYLERPVVPLDRTLANLNFEMIGRPDAKVGGRGAMWLTGDELTNLGPLLRERKFRVSTDPRPEQHFFERSDNYAFVLRGVIGQTFSSYDLHADYHAPSDEADRIDFEHLTECAATGEKAVRLVADGEIALVWTAGKPPVSPR